jgi:hypothetical protein
MQRLQWIEVDCGDPVLLKVARIFSQIGSFLPTPGEDQLFSFPHTVVNAGQCAHKLAAEVLASLENRVCFE